MSIITATNLSSPIVIPFSKGKLILMVIGSVIFIAISDWMWSIADIQTRRHPLFVKAVAVAGSCFFSLCGLYASAAMFDPKPGLVIDENGLIDNSSGVAAGRIHWDEVAGLRINEVGTQRFLTIDVVDPQKFINRCGFFRRMLSSASFRMVGSPINIGSNSLDIDFDELSSLVSSSYERAQLRLSLGGNEFS